MIDNYCDISYFENLYKQKDPYHTRDNVRELFRFSQSLALLEKTHFKIALDLGTGEGFLLSRLAEFSDMVVGIDCSMNALKRAKQHSDNGKVGQGFSLAFRKPKGLPYLIMGDIRKLPLKNEIIDLVVCFETLYYVNVDERNQALDEINRISTRNTQLLFSGRRKETLLQWMKQEFVVKKIKPVSTYLIKVLKWFGPCRRLVHKYSIIKFLVFLGKIFPVFTNQLVISARKK